LLLEHQLRCFAEKADFGPVLMFVDFMYVAAHGREFTNSAQVDRAGVKIGVGRNSSSDQFLSRTLKSAELVRFTGGAGAGLEALRSRKVDVLAASASNVQGIAADLPGAKVLPEAFTNEQYTVALPKGRSAAAQAKVVEIVNEAKKTDVIRKALEQTGVKGVRAAP
jgi:polar amino acid transport system substrate-binding protein